MSNLWLKEYPITSTWLSTSNRVAGSLRGQATAQAKRQVKAVVIDARPRPAFPSTHTAALIAAALVLGACSKAPPESSTPIVTPVQNTAAPTTSGASDTSVPDAGSVLSPAAKADPATGRSNRAMSRDQQSSAMPLPGQNNDHSAPPTPAKRDSGP